MDNEPRHFVLKAEPGRIGAKGVTIGNGGFTSDQVPQKLLGRLFHYLVDANLLKHRVTVSSKLLLSYDAEMPQVEFHETLLKRFGAKTKWKVTFNPNFDEWQLLLWPRREA